MRRDDVLLFDIRDAAPQIAEHIAGFSRAQFLTDKKTQDAVERQVLNMGEAATRMSQAFKDANPQVPWRRLADLRNFYVHAYERVDPLGVWRTATGLARRVAALLEPLVPPDADQECVSAPPVRAQAARRTSGSGTDAFSVCRREHGA